MNAALPLDEELVDVGRRPSDMGIGRACIALLVAAHPHAATALTPDVAGRQRDVHQRRIGAVVVVAPDEALLVSEHRPPPSTAFLGHGDPFGSLHDLGGIESGYFGGLLTRHGIAGDRIAEAVGMGAEE